MARTSGMLEIPIGLIDGPVALDHPISPPKTSANFQANCPLGAAMPATRPARMGHSSPDSSREAHFHGSRDLPGCSLLVRPIFSEAPDNGDRCRVPPPKNSPMRSSTSSKPGRGHQFERGAARPIAERRARPSEALDSLCIAGSLSWRRPAIRAPSQLCHYRHPWVIPVIAYDLRGRPMHLSNLEPRLDAAGSVRRAKRSPAWV